MCKPCWDIFLLLQLILTDKLREVWLCFGGGKTQLLLTQPLCVLGSCFGLGLMHVFHHVVDCCWAPRSLWIWQNRNHNGKLQMCGHSVSHGQAFSLSQGPGAFWGLHYRRHTIFSSRWRGPAPEPERGNSPTGASSYKLHVTLPLLLIVLKPRLIPNCMVQASGLPAPQFRCISEPCPALCTI